MTTPFDQPSSLKGSSDPEGGDGAYSYDGKPDRWKRYRLPDPDTGKAAGFTRATTFAKSMADTFALNQWALRKGGEGLVIRPDLLMKLASTPDSDIQTKNKIMEEAKNAAGAKVGANLGTALHAFSEEIDKGNTPIIPPPYRPHMAAYTALMSKYNLEIVEIEKVVLCRTYGIAGTLDRIVRFTKDTVVETPDGGTYTFKQGTLAILDLKGLALDTPIPTPTGWTTMEKVQPGDQVFGADGYPCNVVAKSATKQIGTYVVKFDDGSEITCDSEHLWQTTTGYGRYAKTKVRGIVEIAETVKGTNGQSQHKIPTALPLVLPEADLPIDPYVLGVWIGDGANRGGTVTKTADLFEILERDGVSMGIEQRDSRKPHVVTRTILGLGATLREAGLTHNKHIPVDYLRGSFSQRLRLLQGLFDTDGSWNTARRTAVFSTGDQMLAEQVEELALTLGQRPHVAYYKRSGFGLEVDSWTVEITPVGINPFRLPRKADQAAASAKNTARASQRVIVSVERGPDVETACIAVDSSDRLFLCGKGMIPTHNTGKDLSYGWMEICIQLAVYANAELIWDKVALEYRLMPPEMDRNVALVVHLPATAPGDTVAATMYAIDIAGGWEDAELCMKVRDARKRKGRATALAVVEEQAVDMAEIEHLAPAGEPAGGRIKVVAEREDTVVRLPTLVERAQSARTEADLQAVWFDAVRTRQDTRDLAAAITARKAIILADSAAG